MLSMTLKRNFGFIFTLIATMSIQDGVMMVRSILKKPKKEKKFNDHNYMHLYDIKVNYKLNNNKMSTKKRKEN